MYTYLSWLNPNLKELWNVENDWENEEKEFVVLDVVLCQQRGEAELAVVADSDVAFKTGKDREKKERLGLSSKNLLLYSLRSAEKSCPILLEHFSLLAEKSCPLLLEHCSLLAAKRCPLLLEQFSLLAPH